MLVERLLSRYDEQILLTKELVVGESERNQNTRSVPFRLTVDQYGRLWLHSKLEGIDVTIDLADKEEAFQIMAAAMDEQKFDFRPPRPEHDGRADNDDELRR